MINEHADPSVVEDITAQLELMAPQGNKYLHREGNSPAHIKAGLIGDSKAIFIEEGRPVLGEWQGIFFCEFDGPRPRSLMVKLWRISNHPLKESRYSFTHSKAAAAALCLF